MSSTCTGKFWAVTSFVASIWSALGFYFPYWIKGHFAADDGDFPVYFGVFRRCSYPVVKADGSVTVLDQCGRYSTFMDIPSIFWQISTISVGTGTCLALLLSLIALISLCFRDIVTVKLARVMGVLQLCSGLLIGGGVAIYPKGWDNQEVIGTCGPESGPYQLGTCKLFWAFYLTAMGGGLTILCSCLSCHSYRRKVNRRLEEDDEFGDGS